MGNFFDDRLPISPSNHEKLKIIHLERNKFAGVLPTDMRFLEALEELWLYDNRLSSYMPSEIGELTNLISLSLSYNDIRGNMPTDVKKLNKLEHLQLHHNRLTGTAVDFQGKIKDYITDCGARASDPARVICEDCTVCCNIDGDCIERSKTYPSEWLSSATKHLPNLAAYIPFLVVLLICILIFIICVAISCSKLRNKLPCIPFEVRDDFQEDSVYKFLLTDVKIGWLVALLAGAVHLFVIILFISSADFPNGFSDTEYSLTCPRYESECGSDIVINDPGWMIFVLILITFLSKDFVDGIMTVYEGVTRCDVKECFAGAYVIFLTMSSAMISGIYNKSTGISNSDIIKDAAILLFLNEIDDQFLSLLKRIFPAWIEKLEEDISFANEIDSGRPSNADVSSQSSTTCTKRDLALEVNASQIA